MEEEKVIKGQPRSFTKKLKDVVEDKEHQIEILGTFVRLGVVVWYGFIITMNYVDIPMVKKSGNSDITFVASVFTGALATFGLTTGKNGGSKPPLGHFHSQEIHQPGTLFPRPHSGGQHGLDEGGRKVRVPSRLQILHLRHLVDSSGYHSVDCRPGPHHSDTCPHD